jgi:predicted enzyme related to lactoylglutathione lyase
VHFELWSADPAKVASFYEKTFGWKIQELPGLDYRSVDTGAGTGINGGIMTPKKGPWPAKLAFYIDVEDLAVSVKSIRDAGGKIHVERQEVPGVGVFALFEDPDGRVLGVWQRKQV